MFNGWAYNNKRKMSVLQKVFRYSAQNLSGSFRYLYSINSSASQGWTFNGLAFQTPVNDPNA
jgi:hypothetical protein